MPLAEYAQVYDRISQFLRTSWSWWPGTRNGDARGRRRARRLIEQSKLFDRTWYLQTYPDIARQRADAVQHYLELGWREGRDPGPEFSSNAYIRANPDVSRAGINPLLHYLEFGQAEGRGAFGRNPHLVPVTSPGEPFGEAAPCFSIPLPADRPSRWMRSFQFGETDNLLVVAGLPVGISSSGDDRSTLDAFDQLAFLSGYGPDSSGVVSGQSLEYADPVLLDAWYLDKNRLRTRWSMGKEASVIRSYQHDPGRDGQLVLVGEGLIASPVDFLDISLRNSYFPVLFVRSRFDGTIEDTYLLAFPSLCRSGVHYAELISLNCETGFRGPAINILKTGGKLLNDLLSIIREAGSPLIEGLRVDLREGDGSQSLFQSDFLQWLSQVARVSISALDPSRTIAGQAPAILPECVRSPVSNRQTGGKLIVTGDMVPTLSVITATTNGEGDRGEATLSLIVADLDPSEPAIIYQMPAKWLPDFQSVAANCAWPRLVEASGDGGGIPAGAIRQSQGSVLSDAELLVPVSQPANLVMGEIQSITWFIWTADWDEAILGSALEALSLNHDAAQHSIAFLGEPAGAIQVMASRLYPDRWGAFDELESAVENISTALAGYLGPGVILHDCRTSNCLSALLSRPEISTASCVLVSMDERSKGSHVSFSDGGEIAEWLNESRIRKISETEIVRILGSIYPVVAPPRDFWVARSSHFAEWVLGRESRMAGLHACLSMITGSSSGASREVGRIRPPKAAKSEAMRCGTLVG